MKRIATVIILAATLLVACGPSREERIEQIEDFEDSIFESAVAADGVGLAAPQIDLSIRLVVIGFRPYDEKTET